MQNPEVYLITKSFISGSSLGIDVEMQVKATLMISLSEQCMESLEYAESILIQGLYTLRIDGVTHIFTLNSLLEKMDVNECGNVSITY